MINIDMKSATQAKIKVVTENLPKNKKPIIIIFVILFIALLPSIYFYNQYQKSQNLLNNPSASADALGKAVIAAVGKLIELPTDEQPTIATVSDKTKLSNEPFFTKAQNGDKVLVYSQNKEVILFRPSLNKIISVGTVNLAPTIATAQPSPVQVSSTPTASPVAQAFSVAIYNGTSTSGLATSAESKITTSLTQASVILKKDAKNNYAKTIVIDVSGKQSQTVSQIAKLLGAQVVTVIPDGEAKSTTDVLVILGTDYVK